MNRNTELAESTGSKLSQIQFFKDIEVSGAPGDPRSDPKGSKPIAPVCAKSPLRNIGCPWLSYLDVAPDVASRSDRLVAKKKTTARKNSEKTAPSFHPNPNPGPLLRQRPYLASQFILSCLPPSATICHQVTR